MKGVVIFSTFVEESGPSGEFKQYEVANSSWEVDTQGTLHIIKKIGEADFTTASIAKGHWAMVKFKKYSSNFQPI